MSGVDGIIARIIDDARQKAQDRLDDARRQADRIRQEAESKASDIVSKAVSNANTRAVVLKERLISMAELEARKDKLKARQEMIDEAFEKAVGELTSMPDNDYLSLLINMAASVVVTGKEEMMLSAADRKKYGARLVKGVNDVLSAKGLACDITLSAADHSCKGGLILIRGKVEINYTFEAILFMRKRSMEEQVVNLLF